MRSQVRNRRGVALPLAIFALVVVGALVSSALFIGMQESTVGRNTVSLQQAFQAAEAGAGIQAAGWNPSLNNNMPVNGVQTFQGQLANNTGWYRGELKRLNQQLFLLRSEGFSQDSATRQQVGLLLRLSPVQINIQGALTTQGATRVGGSSYIDGYDHTPGPWSDCPPLQAPLPGLRIQDSSQITTSGCNNWSCLNGDPRIEEDPSIDSTSLLTFGDLTLDELRGMATKILPGGTRQVQPSLDADNNCDEDNLNNWGDPFNPTAACGGYFPIVWSDGNLHISGVQGQGILIVDGDLEVQGNFQFFGPVIVTGRLRTTGDGGHFQGGVIAANVDLGQTTVLGNAVVQYSSCAIARALQNTAPATPLGDRSWVNLY